MRRLAIIVAGSLTLVAAVPATSAISGGKPDREYISDADQTVDLPAGLACAFELVVTPVQNREVATTYPPDENGDVRVQITGTLTDQFTNAGTGKSITVGISGPTLIVFHHDGSSSFFSRGLGALSLFPTDVPAGPSTFLYSGHLELESTPDGATTVTRQDGRIVQDICAALT